MAAKFTPRMSEPSTSDPHWIHTSKGGLNGCIRISGDSCLPNCVGYAWGRAYEILGSRPKLSRANAEDWYGFNDGYKRSKEPSLGAIICWAKGKAGVSTDGAGHVAVVEEIKPNGDVVTSNSGYKSTRFWTQTFTKASGYKMKNYTFQGFIHILNDPPPAPAAPTPSAPKPVRYLVKITTDGLNIRSEPSTAGKNRTVVGCITDRGVYTIVQEADGPGATKWGKLKSGLGWISLDYTKKIKL